MQSTPPVAELHGLVLSGGRSERFGQDKAALVVDGVVLLDRTVALLEDLVVEVVVSARRDQADDPVRRRHTLVLDELSGCGPVAGLVAAYRRRPDVAWLAVACDMPGLDRALLRSLVRARAPARAGTAWRSPADGLPEPLCAIWEPATLARLAQQVAAGLRVSPRALLAASDTILLDPPRPTALVSINTPGDLERLAGDGHRANPLERKGSG